MGQALLFSLAAVFAVMLLVGLRTRIATALSWVMLVSLHNRNFMVLDAGDFLFRLVLFWSIFVPLGARWSIDALRNRSKRSIPNRFASCGTVALLLQVACVYWFTALLKNHEIWLNGQGILYALQCDDLATDLGVYLLNFPTLLMCLTYGTLVIEALAPTLAFSPWRTGPIRFGVVIVMWCLHLGMGLTLALGHFPFICAAAWCAFLPTWFWERAATWKVRNVVQPVAEFLRRCGERVARRLPPRPLWIHLSKIESAIVILLFMYVLMWNIRTLDPEFWTPYIPTSINPPGEVLALDQYWCMFAPFPMLDNGWYVMPGKLADGSEVNILTGRPVTWDRPQHIYAMAHNTRERKYMTNIWLAEFNGHRLHFARAWCRRWNREHPDPRKEVHTFQIYFMLEKSTPDARISAPEKVLLWDHNCLGK